MSQYKEIRSRPWFQDLYINKYASQLYDFTGSKINTEHLDTFTLDWIEYIEDSGEIDFIFLVNAIVIFFLGKLSRDWRHVTGIM